MPSYVGVDQESRWSELQTRLRDHLGLIYPERDAEDLIPRLLQAAGIHYGHVANHDSLWSEEDVWLITYGDSIKTDGEVPLRTLERFLQHRLRGMVSGLHILPFYPYSSDDGFAVIHYTQVNSALGDWPDIEALCADWDVMFDCVMNHCSSRSGWFENFKRGVDPGSRYFLTLDPDTDVSSVVRPRTSELLQCVETLAGKRWVWCTFSPDQVDLNYEEPDVLIEMVSIVGKYMDAGARSLRLDAVTFLWKELGTRCVNLPQTHEIIRLLRTLVEYRDSSFLLITETNIPHLENLAYFGNGNEAHMIYNFALPPLLLHTFLTGDSTAIRNWSAALAPPPPACCYLNFIASHDGIGLRPVEGILSEDQVDDLVTACRSAGGEISWRSTEGSRRPYELNISLINAFSGGDAGFAEQRMLAAHAIMLAFEGLPAIYLHSLVATENDVERMTHTGHARAINRHQWNEADLEAVLDDKSCRHSRVFAAMRHMLSIRRQQPAFHPNARQQTLQLLDSRVYGLWRQFEASGDAVCMLANVSHEAVSVPCSSLNFTVTEGCEDLLSGHPVSAYEEALHLGPYQVMWIKPQAGEVS